MSSKDRAKARRARDAAARREAMERPAKDAAAAAALDTEVYAQIPATGCKGLCHPTCSTTIGMTETERRRILHERGVHIPRRDLTTPAPLEDHCPALTADKQCGVYDVRPTVCRLWGAVEDLPCPHGCAPAGGRLPARVGHDLLRVSMAIDEAVS